ncbi:MgtC/SapB family protein [Tamlana sp. 2_MG-2023]|uniref:MgtC/SapB family protein n=1 Tax=unclassified Tamlana TaxID=2614803 RepID=UPI0026E1AE20|nr:MULTISPECIES: MgtC/SapB family protein [unclassified Tamlana]MDO6760203.1 MgtC/SapB family protein [Tamlana sp. 2_MG-2023]MDO6790099.1 MgtC/SapB family protein [Tamlana sp. 1_MG-2023]
MTRLLFILNILELESNSYFDFMISIVLAMVAGFCVGLERQMKNKNAGLKTYALVSVGAAIFTNISLQYIGIEYVDLSRIIGHIIVGVGFLGAGVIIIRDHKIKGLATAATIWCSAGLGCMAALKLYIELVSAVVVIVIINIIFGYLNHKIERKNKPE